MNRKTLFSMLILLTVYGYIHALGISNSFYNQMAASAVPVIKITNPKTGDNFKYGKMIYADAEASDVNEAIEVVEFYFEGALVDRDSTAPYSAQFFGYPVTTKGILKAVATNAKGLKSADSVIISVAYNESPTVKLVSPAPASVIKANDLVTIEADAEDSDGSILGVYFWIDNNFAGYVLSPPYRITWKATEGAVNLMVRAYDNDYATTDEKLDLLVGKADFSVKIKKPQNGAVFATGDNIPIEAEVVSPQKKNAVQFFVNDQFIAVDSVPPFTANTVAATGVTNIRAVASSGGKTTEDSVYIKTNDPVINQLPFVRLAGNNGKITSVGSNVYIDARASDPDGNVRSVEFFVNGLSIGVDDIPPFSYLWKAQEGLAEITAIATDNKGAKGKESSSLRMQVVETYTQLKIIEPAEGAVYKPGNKIKIEAFNNCLASYETYARANVQFMVNDKNLGIVMNYPYTIYWIAEKGKAVIKAISRDNHDEVIDSVMIMVDDGTQNLPPVVKLKRPTAGITIDPGKLLSIEANASDADGKVKAVSFFANNTLLSVDSIAPYSTSWTTVAGTAVIKAIAVDNQGAMATDSCTIKVIQNTPPSVKLISPMDGDAFEVNTGAFIQAKASDAEGVVTTVEFFEGNKWLGLTATDPFELYWVPLVAKTTVLRAVATDDKGLKSTDSITVQVTAPIDSVQLKIKSPAFLTTYDIGDHVKIEAEVTAVPPAKVDYVEFQINDSIELTDYTAPYTADWVATAPGIVKLGVFAFQGNYIKAMDTDSIFVKKSAFDVEIINPTEDGDDIGTGYPYTIEALAGDSNNKIEKVEFFVEGTSIGVDLTAPYSAVWPGQGKPGRILIVAVATNTLGKQVSDTVIVNVTPKYLLVEITDPLNGQTVNAGDQITINADVLEYDVVEYHICDVEFFVNDVSIGYQSKTTAFNPFQASWTAQKGYAVIKAVAHSWIGISKDSIIIKVNDTTINNPPVVDLTHPLEGSTYKVNDTVSLEADAFDTDGYVKKVVFSVHDAVGLITTFTDSIAPYACNWMPVKEGSYLINAEATDDQGGQGYSLTVKVNVTKVSGISSTDADKWVSVYPNPAKAFITIETDETASVELVSLDGKVIIQPTTIQARQKQSLNVNNVANGSYLLKVYNTRYISFKRIVINR